jgi:hypothetical protein
MTIKEAAEQIKKAKNTRITPSGNTYLIEIQTDAGWAALPLKNLNRKMAEDIIRQADNKLLLG